MNERLKSLMDNLSDTHLSVDEIAFETKIASGVIISLVENGKGWIKLSESELQALDSVLNSPRKKIPNKVRDTMRDLAMTHEEADKYCQERKAKAESVGVTTRSVQLMASHHQITYEDAIRRIKCCNENGIDYRDVSIRSGYSGESWWKAFEHKKSGSRSDAVMRKHAELAGIPFELYKKLRVFAKTNRIANGKIIRTAKKLGNTPNKLEDTLKHICEERGIEFAI